MRCPRLAILLLALLCLCGCGSLRTLNESDASLRATLRHDRSYCDTLPRVYSGTRFNLCRLNSRANEGTYNLFMLLFLVADTAPSALVDTLVLPHTLKRQRHEGDIDLRP